MTYRFPQTLPYLWATLSAVFLASLFLTPHRDISVWGYALVFACAFAFLGGGLYSLRYSVTIAADRLRITGMQQREVLFSEMTKIEVAPGRGVLNASITLRDGARIGIDGSLRDFAAFTQNLSAATGLPVLRG
jgi:hypothetical protein